VEENVKKEEESLWQIFLTKKYMILLVIKEEGLKHMIRHYIN